MSEAMSEFRRKRDPCCQRGVELAQRNTQMCACWNLLKARHKDEMMALQAKNNRLQM